MTSTKFLRDADNFQVVNAKAINVYEKLPGGNYLIKQTPEGVLYLQMVEDFKPPKKMYGDTQKVARRIRETFDSRPLGTGVLLSGEKGSGKTLLCRTVCIDAAADGIPTIIINMPWKGDHFFSFLSAINQPCIVLFDEFEKVYDTKKNEQDAILTLLDGVFPTKKLFLLTCNDRYGINTNMINRPGRIFYSMEFKGLDEKFIREYSLDNLKDKTRVESILRVTSMFSEFNFDMLQALIEEMNRYDETAADALVLLNVSPVHDFATYKVQITLATGEQVIGRHTGPNEIRNPLSQKGGMNFSVYTEREKGKRAKVSDIAAKWYNDASDDDDDMHHYNITFYPADIISVSANSMTLKNQAGDLLNLTRETYATYDWRKMADTEGAL